MWKLRHTSELADWLRYLRDPRAKAAVVLRLQRAQKGNFGDAAPISAGLSEMRIHVGAGYRIYFRREGDFAYVLLCGGSKSTQRQDIERAIDLWNQIKTGNKQ